MPYNGNYIAELRKDLKMTQDELAEKVGVSHQAISSWERGSSRISTHLVGKVAESLNVNYLVFTRHYFRAPDDPVNENEESFYDPSVSAKKEFDYKPIFKTGITSAAIAASSFTILCVIILLIIFPALAQNTNPTGASMTIINFTDTFIALAVITLTVSLLSMTAHLIIKLKKENIFNFKK